MTGKIVKEIHEKGSGTLFFFEEGGIEHKFFISMRVLGDDPFVEQPLFRLKWKPPNKTFPEIFESHKAFLAKICSGLLRENKAPESVWGINITRKDAVKYARQ